MNCDFGKCFHNLYKLASQEKFRTESLFRVNMIYLGFEDLFQFVCQSKHSEGHSALTHTGGSKKFSCNPKKSLQLHCNPKISAHFCSRNEVTRVCEMGWEISRRHFFLLYQDPYCLAKVLNKASFQLCCLRNSILEKPDRMTLRPQ